eukprot:3756262-Pyramimonas_sp.AAC.1
MARPSLKGIASNGGRLAAFTDAGAGMTVALRCAEEDHILFDTRMAMGVNDEEAAGLGTN